MTVLYIKQGRRYVVWGGYEAFNAERMKDTLRRLGLRRVVGYELLKEKPNA